MFRAACSLRQMTKDVGEGDIDLLPPVTVYCKNHGVDWELIERVRCHLSRGMMMVFTDDGESRRE